MKIVHLLLIAATITIGRIRIKWVCEHFEQVGSTAKRLLAAFMWSLQSTRAHSLFIVDRGSWGLVWIISLQQRHPSWEWTFIVIFATDGNMILHVIDFHFEFNTVVYTKIRVIYENKGHHEPQSFSVSCKPPGYPRGEFCSLLAFVPLPTEVNMLVCI